MQEGEKWTKNDMLEFIMRNARPKSIVPYSLRTADAILNLGLTAPVIALVQSETDGAFQFFRQVRLPCFGNQRDRTGGAATRGSNPDALHRLQRSSLGGLCLSRCRPRMPPSFSGLGRVAPSLWWVHYTLQGPPRSPPVEIEIGADLLFFFPGVCDDKCRHPG